MICLNMPISYRTWDSEVKKLAQEKFPPPPRKKDRG